MPGSDVQQLPGGGGLTSYSFCTCPLYVAWVFLSYLMPSHFIGMLSFPALYFIRGSTPPAPDGAIS